MALVGFLTGPVGPSRDLLVPACRDHGHRAFGVAYSGLDVGLASAPWFSGRSWTRAGTRGLAIFTAARVGAKSRRAATV
jgi:hypothetical protein